MRAIILLVLVPLTLSLAGDPELSAGFNALFGSDFTRGQLDYAADAGDGDDDRSFSDLAPPERIAFELTCPDRRESGGDRHDLGRHGAENEGETLRSAHEGAYRSISGASITFRGAWRYHIEPWMPTLMTKSWY